MGGMSSTIRTRHLVVFFPHHPPTHARAPRDNTYHRYELRRAQLLHLERHDAWCRCWWQGGGRRRRRREAPVLFLSLMSVLLLGGGEAGERKTDWAPVAGSLFSSSSADGQDAR